MNIHFSFLDINYFVSKYYIKKRLLSKSIGSGVMKNWLAGLINDESGAVIADNAFITIILPVLCITLLVAGGISMVTSASLLSAPNAVLEMFGSGLFAR